MADSFSKEYCIHQRIHIFAYFCNHQPRMFIETKFDCHILHSVSKAEKLEHIAHSYASCSFISPRNTICFSEEDCMHQKVLIISISAVHCALTMECITPFQGMACTLKVSVKVTPQEMLQSLQGNVQRERERPPSSKNVPTLCKIPLHTDSIFIG